MFPPHIKFTLSPTLHIIVINPPLLFPRSVPFTQSQFLSPSIDSILLHSSLLFTPILLRLQHYPHSPSNITPHFTPLSFQTSAAVAAAAYFLFSITHSYRAHTLYYPLCSHLTLTPLHVITQFELSPTQLYRPASLLLLAIALFIPIFTTPLLLCLPTFTTTKYILPIPYYQHYSHFLIFNSTFLRMAHTLLFESILLLRPSHPSPIPYFCAIALRFHSQI